MAKEAYLNNSEVLTIIGRIYLAHKDWKAKEILIEVNEVLESNGLRQIALSTVQRELAKYHKKEKEKLISGYDKGIDKPWSIGVSKEREYDLPLDHIPILLEIQNWRLELKQPPITIREAKWAARLFPSILYFSEGEKNQTTIKMIDFWSRRYALLEEASEITKTDFCTSGLDQALFKSKGDIKKGIELMGKGWVLLAVWECEIIPAVSP